MGRLARAGTLPLVLLCLAVAAPAAGGAEKAIWGPTTLPGGDSAFALYERLGVDTLQVTLAWAQVAPTRPRSPRDPDDPAYRWPPELTAAVDGARRHGIRLAVLVSSSPGWANGGRPAHWAPRDAGDYADFLRAAARRYRSVRRWMIWGEPNKAERFRPNATDRPTSARRYALLLDAAYGALKGESRRNKVIGGMTWTSGTVKPLRFMRWMRLPDGRRPRLDWFGHNPFPFRFPRLTNDAHGDGDRDISDAATFSREIRRAFGRHLPLWFSEYTVQSDRGSSTFASFVSRRAQARYLTAAFRIADRLGGSVAGMGWLALLDEPEAPGSARWGLLTHDLAPKPAYWAMIRAPSRRQRPSVAVAARRISRRGLAARGLAVSVRARRGGTVSVELRRGSRLVRRRQVRATAGRRRSVRLRARTRPGRYAVHVRAPRSETVRRAVRVR